MKNKISFDTEIEVREELERILNTQNKPWLKSQTKPCRWYFENGKYFLTSKPKIYEYAKS